MADKPYNGVTFDFLMGWCPVLEQRKKSLALFLASWPGLKTRLSHTGRRLARDNAVVKALAVHKWSILFVTIGFLLGRAMILEQLSPFALAYFAVIYFLRQDLIFAVAMSSLAGSVFSLHQNTLEIAFGMLLFLLIQKGLQKYERTDISMAPLIVFLVMMFTGLFELVLRDQLHWYPLTLAAVESTLGLVLTLIFIQALPVMTLQRKDGRLRNEEIVCLMILLASIMTGTVGWTIEGASVEHILSRYLILLFALVGGAPLGASVGVIAGLILSLARVEAIYQISLLAFAGLLAGLLKEGKKAGVSLGLLVGASILSLYVGEQSQIMASLVESLAAILLFWLTPRSFISMLAKYVPGTAEHIKSTSDYAKRIRDMTAARVEQFSEVFRQLSRSFTQLTEEDQKERNRAEVDHFLDSISARACMNCHRQRRCWEDQFAQTYRWMTELMSEIERDPQLNAGGLKPEWKSACVKPEQILKLMKQKFELFRTNQRWRRQLQESRQLVADQLFGVSQVMEDLAREIKREGQEMHMQEEQIRQALEDLGLSIHSIDIISLDPGSVEIEMVHQYNSGMDECRKIIAPLLSDILGENITVRSEQELPKGGGYRTVMFTSAKEYEVETGIAGAAKGGDLWSGDSFSMMELGNGKFAVALSDGMGNGERASRESSTTLAILRELLKSGMDERLAVKSVNSILLLRSPEEMFATIDVALIDLYSAKTTFLKTGSTPSFIRRGDEVFTIFASNLPVGILHDIDIDLVTVQLMPGDTLIMMTDGLLDAPGYAVNKEKWMKRVIRELQAESPQDIADCLLEMAVRHRHGDIRDDMTVVVARIEKYKPEWATFRWPGIGRIERPKVVS
jgi:stage II sporulation protein E